MEGGKQGFGVLDFGRSSLREQERKGGDRIFWGVGCRGMHNTYNGVREGQGRDVCGANCS